MRYVWDALFVALLPALCFSIDPILFGYSFGGKPMFSEAIQIATYLCVAISVILFFVSFLNISSRFLKLIITGALLSGSFVAAGLGVLVFPLTLLGIVLIVGLLGFIPFFTASRFWKRYKEFRPLGIMQPDELMLIFLGFAIPFIPAIFTYNEIANLRSQVLDDLTSKDGDAIRSAMRKVGTSFYCNKYCTNEVIEKFEAGSIKISESQFSSLLLSSTGIDYQQFINDRIND